MTKKALYEKCKDILNRAEELPAFVSSEDEEFLLTEIFPLHKEWIRKKGAGIKYIYVDNSGMYNSRCFYIKRDDGSITDISYKHCLAPRSRYNDIVAACRYAVKPIVEAKMRSTTFPTVCPLTGKLLPDKSFADVDHYDKPFHEVVKEWVAICGEGPLSKWINDTKDGSPVTKFIARDIEESFIEYHNANTHLRVISREQNRKMGKNSK